MRKYTDLKEVHDSEVKDLFENIGTLKFVKEMRFFKKEWDEQITEKKRKKVAAAASAALCAATSSASLQSSSGGARIWTP